MSRWVKRLLVGGLVILVLLGVGAGVLLATMDQQAYKTWLQDQVRERYGRTLDIQGEVSVRLFPDLGLSITKVSLSEPDSSERFALVNQANISVSLKPLFQRQLSIDQILLDGLDAKLRRDQHGKWNVSDLMGPGRRQPGQDVNKDAAHTDTSLISAPMAVNIHKLELKQASIAVFDRSKPWVMAKNLNASIAKVSSAEEYDLLFFASLDVPSEGQADVSIKSRIGLSQDMTQFTAKGSEMKLAKGQQHTKKGLRQMEWFITLDTLMAQPSNERVSGTNFTLKAKGLQDADRFEWSGDLASFRVERSVGVVPAMSGRLRLDGPNALDAKYQVSGLSFKPGLIDTRSVKVDIGVKQAMRLYRLDVESPLTIRTLNTVQATSVKGTLHLADPDLPAGSVNLPLTGVMGYDLGKQEATWKLATSFLDSPIDFSGHVNDLGKDVPKVSAKFNTDRLDLNAIDAFLNQPKPAVKAGQSGSSAKTGPSTKPASSADQAVNAAASSSSSPSASTESASRSVAVGQGSTLSGPVASPSQQPSSKASAETNVSWMRKLDLDLQMRASRFVWQKIHASQLQLQLDVQNGRAQLRSLQAVLYGGTLSAEGGLSDAKGLPTWIKGKLNAVQVEPFVTALTGDSLLGGVGTMSFDLKASATDSSGLLKSLDGQSQIDIKQGYIRGLDLNKGVEALSDPTGRAKDLPLAMDKSKRTNLSVMQTQVLFGQGLARLHKLNLSSNNLRITEGKVAQIGLTDGSLDVVTDVQFSGNIGVPGARVAIQVRSLVVPMHIGGTLQDPQVRVHWQSMPEDALKQSLQQLLMQGVIGGSGGFLGIGSTNSPGTADSATPAAPGTAPNTAPSTAPSSAPNPAKQLENVIRGLFGR